MPEMYVRWDDLKELIESKPSGIITAEDIKRLERVSFNCELPRNGDIVRNTNNNAYGVVLRILPDKNCASILEVSAHNEVFVNCPPLAALEKTGKRLHLCLAKMIMKEVKGYG